MGIQRIQQAGFAQISNGALRDRRLSWRARGLLAFVLSHPAEFNAPRDWLTDQSDQDGQFVVRSIFKELEGHGYRKVVRSQDSEGKIKTDVHWYQYPYGDPNFKYDSRLVGIPPDGLTHQ